MLSLDKFPDWSVFAPREEVAPDTEVTTPAAEAASMLAQHQFMLQQIQQSAEEERHTLLCALAQQAVYTVQFAMMLERYENTLAQAQETHGQLKKAYRSLRITKDKMLDSLRVQGIEIEFPIGKACDDLPEATRIESWHHSEEYTSEQVIEVREPIVRYKGILLHPGCVIMGAPIDALETIPYSQAES